VTSPPPQCSVTYKFAKDTVHVIDELIDKDIKQLFAPLLTSENNSGKQFPVKLIPFHIV